MFYCFLCIYYTKLIPACLQVFEKLLQVGINFVYNVNKGGVNMGKIANTNTRTNITISKEMKEQLTNIAKSENRSFNNLVITILKDYLTSKGQ